MKRIENIGNEGLQSQVIPLSNGDAVLTIRFLSLVQIWTMDVTYNERAIYGVKLSCGVIHMRSKNFPFDFIVEDTSSSGLDPFQIEDFSSGRTILYLVEAEEMEEIRGQAVI
tara:strand:+ start:17780 stop:18115 length:336 start_codon:yes stop_codon:yes gene_type:complete